MYPILVLLGIGLFRKETIVAEYVKPLALAGGVVALYHSIIQISGNVSEACGATGAQCGERLVFEFSYITIPMMSLTIFILIFLFMLLGRSSSQ